MRPTKLPWAKNLCAVMALVWRCDARLSLLFSLNGRRPLLRRMSFSRQMVDDLLWASDMSFGLVFSLAQARAWAGAARPMATAAAAMASRRVINQWSDPPRRSFNGSRQLIRMSNPGSNAYSSARRRGVAQPGSAPALG